MKNLKFENDEDFEILIVLSLLSRSIVDIVLLSKNDTVFSFLDFIKIISPDSSYSYNEKSNILTFYPKACVGGKYKMSIDSNICTFLTSLILISPFIKSNIEFEFTGITNDPQSVDVLKITFFKIYKLFNLKGFEINIKKRGFGPIGEGIVLFKEWAVKSIDNFTLLEDEQILKIRGLVITSRIGSEYSRRMIQEINERMSDLGNTKVLSIINNRNDSGPSPGFECTVMAESKNGIFYNTSVGDASILPEILAKDSCHSMLKSMRNQGIFDYKILPYVLIYMGFAKNIGILKIGKLDSCSKRTLEYLKKFFNIEYRINMDKSLLTIVGCGHINQFMSL